MAALDDLENSLNDVFVKQAPALPEGGKKLIIQYLPWINLILGVATLWAAYWLWHWAHWANQVVHYVNAWNSYYGQPGVPVIDRMSPLLWLSLVVLTVEAILYIAAFSATYGRQKRGWDLLFYAALTNIVYGFLVMFTSYGGAGNFIGSLLGSIVGLYFLFQIRGSYLAKDRKPRHNSNPKD